MNPYLHTTVIDRKMGCVPWVQKRRRTWCFPEMSFLDDRKWQDMAGDTFPSRQCPSHFQTSKRWTVKIVQLLGWTYLWKASDGWPIPFQNITPKDPESSVSYAQDEPAERSSAARQPVDEGALKSWEGLDVLLPKYLPVHQTSFLPLVMLDDGIECYGHD